MDTLDTQKTQKNASTMNRYFCEGCSFGTKNKTDYLRHCNSKKHVMDTQMDTKKTQKNVLASYVCDCGKRYKYSQGLSKHRQRCNFEQNEEDFVTPAMDTSNNMIIPYEMFMQLMKQNSEFKELMIDQTKQMVEIVVKNGVGNTSNSHNTNSHNNIKNKFNINLFLNEKCKDAMNIMDFVNTMQLQLSDLERVGELGYVKGISHIVVNKLKDLDITKRPIHCSDAKRETMYVKDENMWEKENEKKEKLAKMIKHVAHKNQKQINEWQQENPEYKDSESVQSEKFLKIVGESMTGLTNDDESECCTNRIIKNIAKEVIIKEE
jgi:hypothetical protein